MAQVLAELQLHVMEQVWRLGKATVADVHEAMSRDRKIAYSTVLTTMRALERKGMLVHEVVGKAFNYTAVVSREGYASGRLDKLTDDLFGGSRVLLLQHLLGNDRIGQNELDEIRRIIRKSRGGKP